MTFSKPVSQQNSVFANQSAHERPLASSPNGQFRTLGCASPTSVCEASPDTDIDRRMGAEKSVCFNIV
jgi:hypothetical protein